MLHPRNQPVLLPVRVIAQDSQYLFFQLENEESLLCCIQEISQFCSLFGFVPKIRNIFFFNLKTKKAGCVAVFIKGQLWNKICFCTFFDFLSFTRKDQLLFLQIGGSNSVSYKVPYSILIVLIKNL